MTLLRTTINCQQSIAIASIERDLNQSIFPLLLLLFPSLSDMPVMPFQMVNRSNFRTIWRVYPGQTISQPSDTGGIPMRLVVKDKRGFPPIFSFLYTIAALIDELKRDCLAMLKPLLYRRFLVFSIQADFRARNCLLNSPPNYFIAIKTQQKLAFIDLFLYQHFLKRENRTLVHVWVLHTQKKESITPRKQVTKFGCTRFVASCVYFPARRYGWCGRRVVDKAWPQRQAFHKFDWIVLYTVSLFLIRLHIRPWRFEAEKEAKKKTTTKTTTTFPGVWDAVIGIIFLKLCAEEPS